MRRTNWRNCEKYRPPGALSGQPSGPKRRPSSNANYRSARSILYCSPQGLRFVFLTIRRHLPRMLLPTLPNGHMPVLRCIVSAAQPEPHELLGGWIVSKPITTGDLVHVQVGLSGRRHRGGTDKNRGCETNNTRHDDSPEWAFVFTGQSRFSGRT